MFNMILGKKLAQWRASIDFTQEQMAEMCDVSTGTIKNYEGGKRTVDSRTQGIIETCVVFHRAGMGLLTTAGNVDEFVKEQIIEKVMKRFM